MHRVIPLAMVVDDSALDRTLAVQAISGALENVLEASDGTEGLALIEERIANGEQLPDVIFLDLRMPVLNGLGFLDGLITIWPAREPPPRVLVLTGSDEDPCRLEVLGHPFVLDYIVKPLIRHDALRIVEKLVSGRSN